MSIGIQQLKACLPCYTSSLELSFHFWLIPADVHTWLVDRVAVFRLAEEVGNAGGFLCMVLCDPFSLACCSLQEAWLCGVRGWPEPLGTTCGGVGWTVGQDDESPEILCAFPDQYMLLDKSIACLYCCLLQSLLPGCTAQHWIQEAKSFSDLETVQGCIDLHGLR